jgi:hypothetical protein
MKILKIFDEHILRFVSIVLREYFLEYIKSITQSK